MECISCQSDRTNYDRAFGFWKCEECSELWAFSKDDPDWEDLEPDVNLSAHLEYLAECQAESVFPNRCSLCGVPIKADQKWCDRFCLDEFIET